MFHIFGLFLAFLGCVAAGQISHLNGRIVGGLETTIEAHPFQVSVQLINGGDHICGGCIISNIIVLTAAHCLVNYKAVELAIRLRSANRKEGGELINVEKVQPHPRYNPYTMENDIALIKLKRKIDRAEEMIIALADRAPESGIEAVITGWGKRSQQSVFPTVMLRAVTVRAIDYKNCSSPDYDYGAEIKNTMICASAPQSGACEGDSGGPLVAHGKVIGVDSWANGCARPKFPTVFTSVPASYEWLISCLASL